MLLLVEAAELLVVEFDTALEVTVVLLMEVVLPLLVTMVDEDVVVD